MPGVLPSTSAHNQGVWVYRANLRNALLPAISYLPGRMEPQGETAGGANRWPKRLLHVPEILTTVAVRVCLNLCVLFIKFDSMRYPGGEPYFDWGQMSVTTA